jgi:hypothetical protein
MTAHHRIDVDFSVVDEIALPVPTPFPHSKSFPAQQHQSILVVILLSLAG